MFMLLSDVNFVILLLCIRNWNLATSAFLQLMHNLELIHIVYNIYSLVPRRSSAGRHSSCRVAHRYVIELTARADLGQSAGTRADYFNQYNLAKIILG